MCHVYLLRYLIQFRLIRNKKSKDKKVYDTSKENYVSTVSYFHKFYPFLINGFYTLTGGSFLGLKLQIHPQFYACKD